MADLLRVLVVEDVEDDALLLTRELRTAGYDVIWKRVETAEAMLSALETDDWDLVVADYNMPSFNAPAALSMLQKSGLDLPFIIVSGSVGEDVVVEAMRAGAHDYLLKGNLKRLLPAVRRELEQAEQRRARRQAEEQYHLLFEKSPQPMWVGDRETLGFLAVNRAAIEQYGFAREEFLAMKITDIRAPEGVPAFFEAFSATAAGPQKKGVFKHCRKDGTLIDAEVTTHTITFAGREADLVVAYDVTDRVRAEQALEASERRYRELVAFAPVGIYRSTREGRYVSVNEAFTRLLGYDSPDEVLALDLRTEVFDETDREAMAAQVEAGAGVVAFETRLKRRDGSALWVRVDSRAIRGDSGEVEFFEDFVHDIQERKSAEEALRQSEERFRRSFAVSPIGMSLSEAKSGRLVDVNEHFARTLGYEPEELLGRTSVEIGFWADPDVRNRIARAVEKATPIRGQEVRLRTKTGEIRDVLGSIEPLRIGSEQVLLSVFQDITERKKAEEALRTSEARKRAVLDASLDAIITIDELGQIVEVNPAASRTFAFLASEMVGSDLAELIIPPRLRAAHRAGLERQRLSGESRVLGRVLEMTAQRRDGGEFPVELFLSRVDVDGAPHFIGFIRDITERRSLEEQLRLSQKMEAVGQLAGGVAHDFNNLLTTILGYADLLESRPELGDAAEEIGEIRKAGERAAGLTRQLLAFSRRQVLEPVVVGVNDLIANLEKMLGRLIGEDIDLVSRLDASASNVRADPGQLEQVIMNLAVNARDAMPRGGKLTIETANVDLDEAYAQGHISVKPGSYVMVSVSDTGAGMDTDTQARIFEPFFTTKEKGKGTGLGLSTVYGIVKQSGGYIWVYSEVGKGTTFKLYFPRVHEEATTRQARTPHREVIGGNETLLLVEDDSAVRKLARMILERGGYRVLEASSGREALDLMRSMAGAIQLLVTDLVMPDMSGTDLAEQVVAARPGTRVLYMSGYTDDVVVRHGLLEPGRAFLQKPFTPESLSIKVREALA